MDSFKNTSSISRLNEVIDSKTITDLLANTSLGKFQNYSKVGVQIKWAGLTGTLDGSIKLQERCNSKYSFVDISSATATLNSADGTAIISITDFTSLEVNLNLTIGSITGGSISVCVISKR